MNLKEEIASAFREIFKREQVNTNNFEIIVVDRDPTENLIIDFENSVIEFNESCLKIPTFKISSFR